jgi:hypothetical protein
VVAEAVEVVMWKPWTWGRASNDTAVVNARAAATDLARRRVELAEVEHYLQHRGAASGTRSRRDARPA